VRRAAPIALVLLALGVGAAAGLVAAHMAPPVSSAGSSPSPVARATLPPPSSSSGQATPAPTASPTASPNPTPVPTPTLVAAPLDGVLVTPAQAAQHPIAVMVDDQIDARPQSGFNGASVVWQAPAEGGIPRYMLIFQENAPGMVGPVRSARYYFIAWAAEWRAMYVHAGGSPQALSTLRSQGNGQLVYNADDFRYEGRYLWRVKTRFAPHNLYTDGTHLRSLAKVVRAKDGPLVAAWTFAPDAPLADRPIGGRIAVAYPYNAIRYDYDRATNTYRRSVLKTSPQVDAADRKPVAPKNVIVMLVRFGPLNDGHPNKKRLEATVVGKGTAWIATNGQTIKGTWRKDALTKPTQFFDAAGNEVTLTVGQTFVQVMPTGTPVTITNGKAPPAPIIIDRER
jgi:DUF3048 family protein